MGGRWGWDFLTRYPPPPDMGCIKGVRGAYRASTVCFGKNFIKQKLLGTPDLVGVGHLFGPQIWIPMDLGPCPSGAMVTHYEG